MTEPDQPKSPRGRLAKYGRYGLYFVIADVLVSGLLAVLVVAR